MSNLVVDTLGEEDIEDEDDNFEQDVLIPNVKSEILEKVIEYCEHYKKVEEMSVIQTPLQSSKLEEVVQDWYVGFCKVEDKILFDIVSAANFMDIKPLLDLACLAVAVSLKGKSESEINKIFNIGNSTSIAEDREIQLENEWSDKP